MWNLFHVQFHVIINHHTFRIFIKSREEVICPTFSFLHLVNDKKFLYNAYLIDILQHFIHILIHFIKAILILQATSQDN